MFGRRKPKESVRSEHSFPHLLNKHYEVREVQWRKFDEPARVVFEITETERKKVLARAAVKRNARKALQLEASKLE